MADTPILEAFESNGSHDCGNGYTVAWMMVDVAEGKGNIYDVAVYPTVAYGAWLWAAQLLGEASNVIAEQVNDLIKEYSKKQVVFFVEGRVWTYQGEHAHGLESWRSAIGIVFAKKGCDPSTVEQSILDYSDGYWRGQYDARIRASTANLRELEDLKAQNKAVSD